MPGAAGRPAACKKSTPPPHSGCAAPPRPARQILATTDHQPGIVYCEMDFGQLEERRANMPLRQQKRPDLYALLDCTRESSAAQ